MYTEYNTHPTIGGLDTSSHRTLSSFAFPPLRLRSSALLHWQPDSLKKRIVHTNTFITCCIPTNQMATTFWVQQRRHPPRRWTPPKTQPWRMEEVRTRPSIPNADPVAGWRLLDEIGKPSRWWRVSRPFSSSWVSITIPTFSGANNKGNNTY